MTAHKHAEMIKAKADNMDLVVFINHDEGWEISGYEELICLVGRELCLDREFFLCLPQHKEVCLHWLNGGEVEYQRSPTNEWSTISSKCVFSWGFDVVFMQSECNTRIKPRKEKRWIAIDKNGYPASNTYKTKDAAEDDVINPQEWQFIEIEVEV